VFFRFVPLYLLAVVTDFLCILSVCVDDAVATIVVGHELVFSSVRSVCFLSTAVVCVSIWNGRFTRTDVALRTRQSLKHVQNNLRLQPMFSSEMCFDKVNAGGLRDTCLLLKLPNFRHAVRFLCCEILFLDHEVDSL